MNKTWSTFKGKRDYLHSTTVFDHVLTLVDANPASIDFKFLKKTDRICIAQAAKPANSEHVVAIYADSRNSRFIVETDAPVTQRHPYDEDGLGTRFKLEGKTIYVPAQVEGFSFIECAVAAFKRLLLSLDRDNAHRFAFVRIMLDRVPASAFDVQFVRKISGNFYQGVLSERGAPVGKIFFGEWL